MIKADASVTPLHQRGVYLLMIRNSFAARYKSDYLFITEWNNVTSQLQRVIWYQTLIKLSPLC